MTYRDVISWVLADEVVKLPNAVVMAENLTVGSNLMGLGAHLNGKATLLNLSNCESCHVGVGLGMLLNGVSSVLLVKQLDFLLLAVDQLHNSWQLIQAAYKGKLTASFTILAVIAERNGPQNGFDKFLPFCNLFDLDSWEMTEKTTERRIEMELAYWLNEPGLHLIGVPQALLGREVA